LVPAVATPNQNFVSQVYSDLLLRQVDIGGLNAATNFLNSGGSRVQVLLAVETSTEYLTNQVNAAVYHRFLGRAADPNGLNAAVAFIQHGGTVEQLIVTVADSPEFLALHGGTNDGWLDGMYAALNLGNPPGTVDATSRSGWDAVFARGVTRLEVANLLVTGIQVRTATVTLIYQQYLRRNPDPVGLSSATSAELQFGSALVRANLLASPEYFAFAQINPQTPIPTISSFTPVSGPVGTTVTINGNFLNNTTAVTIGGNPVSLANITKSQLTVTIPNGAVASRGPIIVFTPFGTATSASNFTIGPGITSFDPATGPQGTSVTITGTNLTGATNVTIDGLTVPANLFTVNSATQITATVPTGGTVGTSGPVTVTTSFGTTTSASIFTLTMPGSPEITSFSPTSGTAGTVVTITGLNLFGVTSVTFNGVAAAIVPNSNTTTQVQVTAPAATNGTITVTTTPGLMGTSSGIFSYPPTIDPISGTATEGQALTITGTNLLGATSVQFNGTTAVPTNVTNTSLTVVVPFGARSGNVTVTTGGGTTAPRSATVQGATTATAVDFPHPSGAMVTFTITVSLNPSVSGFPTPTGTVDLMEGATLLTSGTLTNGTVMLSHTFTEANHTVNAVYHPDADFSPSSGMTMLMFVDPDMGPDDPDDAFDGGDHFA
jgi:hypothetical protein